MLGTGCEIPRTFYIMMLGCQASRVTVEGKQAAESPGGGASEMSYSNRVLHALCSSVCGVVWCGGVRLQNALYCSSVCFLVLTSCSLFSGLAEPPRMLRSQQLLLSSLDFGSASGGVEGSKKETHDLVAST